MKHHHVTLEPASSVSNTGDSSGCRYQSNVRCYTKNSHTDSTNISYNMPTNLTVTETSDSGYQNSNVCVHTQPNRSTGLAACFDSELNQAITNKSKGFKTNNKLSVMMLMPGIAAIERPELYYASTAASNTIGIPGFELRKRSNSFTHGQTTANFLSQLDNEYIQHQLLYQTPFIFNDDVAQRTLQQVNDSRNQQQKKSKTTIKTSNEQNLNMQPQQQVNEKSGQQINQINNDQQSNDQKTDEMKSTKINQKFKQGKVTKVNFNLSSFANRDQSENNDEDEVIAKELNNNSDKIKQSSIEDDLTAELTSQCSLQMVTSGEQDEESQI